MICQIGGSDIWLFKSKQAALITPIADTLPQSAAQGEIVAATSTSFK